VKTRTAAGEEDKSNAPPAGNASAGFKNTKIYFHISLEKNRPADELLTSQFDLCKK